jgi:hypothetical protein
MYTYSHSLETSAQPQAIWHFYSDVNLWHSWDHEVQKVDLNGSFVTGTTGTMYISGQPPLPLHLTEVSPNVSFTDETALEEAGLVITFVHTLTTLATGGTRITHAVVIDGPAAATLGMEIGPNITADIPAAMEALAQCALDISKG